MVRPLACLLALTALLLPAAPAGASKARWSHAKAGGKATKVSGERAQGWRARRAASVGDPCARTGRGAVDGALDLTSATVGETITATYRNTGQVCVTHGLFYSVERWRDGDWHPAGTPPVFPAIGYVLRPGEVTTMRYTVEEGLEPGRHRLVKWFGLPVSPALEFQVV